MKFIIANALSFACLAAMVVIGIIMYPGLPETIPTQYNFEGVAGNYMPKLVVVLIMPMSYAVSIVVINLMIRFSPEKFAMTNSLRAMDIIVFSAGLLLLASHVGLMVSLGDADSFHQYFAIGMACFLIISGNVIGKTERNFIFGIRIPWTVASMENWRATHRFAGRLMVISGLLLLPLSLYWPSLLLNLALGLGWLVVAAIYSFVFYLKNERNSENKKEAS
ncbi:MAG: hypothetical protein COB20_04775 [SAR86 cluster bacterium]|uniref:DUF1648 domain-containing protein n=1 Tax=SAR86 cluster bacterium TaxID=2030880 RepID=A0A2A4XBJ3_9GAMM|nr:MAG: hypothetical protein COB20_04775 [SAR86 cluster bacterium]